MSDLFDITSGFEESNDSEDVILDSRFQSYSRYYIYDIRNAEMCDQSETDNFKKNLIKINDLYLYKIAICGIIVSIYEAEKFYRLKIDDSTGCIHVTLWKNLIFQNDTFEIHQKENFSEVYDLLSSIRSRTRESRINKSLMYEPNQGDLVFIRATVKCFKQKIDLNAISCVRVEDSCEEVIQIFLPSFLSSNVYNIPSINNEKLERIRTELNNLRSPIKTTDSQKPASQVSELKNKKGFINLVYKKLVEMASSRLNSTNQTTTSQANEGQSCDSYAIFGYIKNNCPVEFRLVTYRHVLEALKELELNGLAYSCEDEFHFLPIY